MLATLGNFGFGIFGYDTCGLMSLDDLGGIKR